MTRSIEGTVDTVGTSSKEPRTVPYLRIRNPYRIRTVSTVSTFTPRAALALRGSPTQGCPHLHPGRKAIRHSFLEICYYGRLSAQNSGGTAYRAAG
jgi:hypothetical protein